MRKAKDIKQKYEKRHSPGKKSVTSKFKPPATVVKGGKVDQKLLKLEKKKSEKSMSLSKMATSEKQSKVITKKEKEKEGSVISSISSGSAGEHCTLAELRENLSGMRTLAKVQGTSERMKKKTATATVSKLPVKGQ